MDYQTAKQIHSTPTLVRGGDLANNVHHDPLHYSAETLVGSRFHQACGERVQPLTDPPGRHFKHASAYAYPIEVPNYYVHRASPSPIYVRNLYVAPGFGNTDEGRTGDVTSASDLCAGTRLDSKPTAHEGRLASAVDTCPRDRNHTAHKGAISQGETHVNTTRSRVSTVASLQLENHGAQMVARPPMLRRAPATNTVGHLELNFREIYPGRRCSGEPQTTYTCSQNDSAFRLFTEPRTKKERAIETCPHLSCTTGRKNSATRVYTQLRKQMEKEREEAAAAKRIPPQRKASVLPKAHSVDIKQQEIIAHAHMTSHSRFSEIGEEHNYPARPCVFVGGNGYEPYRTEWAAFTTFDSSGVGQTAPSYGALPSSSCHPTSLIHYNQAQITCSQLHDFGNRDAEYDCAAEQDARDILEIVDCPTLEEPQRGAQAVIQLAQEGFDGEGGVDEKKKLYWDLVHGVLLSDTEADQQLWAERQARRSSVCSYAEEIL